MITKGYLTPQKKTASFFDFKKDKAEAIADTHNEEAETADCTMPSIKDGTIYDRDEAKWIKRRQNPKRIFKL